MNNTNKSISILASFSTLKILSDTKKYKNSYQILSEFICYIISTQKIYTFTASEMKNKLKTVFGVNIPEAVVKTTSKNLPFVTKTQVWAFAIVTIKQKMLIFLWQTAFFLCFFWKKRKNNTHFQSRRLMRSLLSAYRCSLKARWHSWDGSQ